MENHRELRSRVLAHSAAALGFFLGLAFLPRLIPALQQNPLFFWICVLGAIVSFIMTNRSVSRQV
jgi:putative flippase GtrA